METTVIILIIIILILCYFLYSSSKKSSANNSSKLYNLNNTNTSISSVDLTNPQSNNFSYCSWIYVNTWNNTNSSNTKMIYNASSGSTNIIKLEFPDPTKPRLTAKIGTNQSITITNNCPIQKWVFVVISVDSQIADCYLDGKLVSSRQLDFVPSIPSAYTINFGVFDAYLTGFKYDSKAMNPQQVWSAYMAGNGYTGGKYGVNFAITKDNAVVSQISY